MRATLKTPLGFTPVQLSSQNRGIRRSSFFSPKEQIQTRHRWIIQPQCSFSDMSREAQEKALAYQLKQSAKNKESTPPVQTTKKLEEEEFKESEGDENSESVKTQRELASRTASIMNEQMKGAIQRQVGATEAKWTDLSEEKEQVKVKVKEVKKEVEAVKQKVGEVKKEVEAVKEKVDIQKEEEAVKQKEEEEIKMQVEAVEQKIEVKKEAEAIKQKVGEVKEKAETVKQEVEVKVGEVKKKVEAVEEKVEAKVKNKVQQTKKEVVTAKQKVEAEVKKKMQQIKKEVVAAKQEVKVEKKMQTVKSKAPVKRFEDGSLLYTSDQF